MSLTMGQLFKKFEQFEQRPGVPCQSAKRSLILIDNWATAETLDLFAKKHKGVKVTIF